MFKQIVVKCIFNFTCLFSSSLFRGVYIQRDKTNNIYKKNIFFWFDLSLLAVFIIFILFCHQVVCLIHLVFRQTRELNSRQRTMAQTVSPYCKTNNIVLRDYVKNVQISHHDYHYKSRHY
jgi:hypothetical protein